MYSVSRGAGILIKAVFLPSRKEERHREGEDRWMVSPKETRIEKLGFGNN